jgi:hypothetical protein
MKKFIAFFLLYSSSVFSNDGFGELGVGGIILDKSQDIVMKSEVLDISYSEISVAYEFENETNKSVSTKISFPLPSYGAMPAPSGVLHRGQPSGFEVLVNGEKLPYKTVVRAFKNKRDITEILLSAGLTYADIVAMPFRVDNPKEDFLTHGINKNILSDKQIKILDENALLDTYSSVSSSENSGVDIKLPNWDIEVVYVWEYTFKPKSITKVSHKYIPFISSGAWSEYSPVSASEFIENYCADEKVINKLNKNYNAGIGLSAYNGISGTQLEYILKTANSWKGKIKEFTLRLHKGNKSEFIALCFPGEFKKINDLTLEVKLFDFSPTQDLKVMFMNASPDNYDTGVIPDVSTEEKSPIQLF